ncbi:MAG: DUF1588 domain-containing protein, partial [Planctomycetota bacterium]
GAAIGRTAETDRIQQLSVDDAKRLAQEKSGQLLLNGLTTLSAEAAKELAKHDGWLALNGLTSLSNEAAEALGQHKGYLHLNGLTKISDEEARALARHKGELQLNGLRSISDEAAKAFAQHNGGRLSLKGVTKLSTEGLKALAQRKGGGPSFGISLDGLSELSLEAAAALAEAHPHNWDGRLPGMKTVPVEVARVLAKRQHGLSMEGLETISDEAAKALLGKLGGNLPRLTTLNVETAKAIAKSQRSLNLDGLTALPDDVALVIGGKDGTNGELRLNGLTSLTPIAAKAICQREGDLYLNGLTTISDETLKALAEHKAHPDLARPIVFLKGLTALSDENALVLASWPKWCGQIPAVPTLSEKAAAAIAGSRNWDGRLPALKTLSPEIARALASRRGNLALDGLTVLSDDAATALAEQQGGTLSLNGLKEISDKAAAALAQREGRLSLNGLATLSSGAAAALAKSKGDWLYLDGLTSLSDDAAKSLAQYQGMASMAGLTTASNDAVKSLRSAKIDLPEKFRAMVVHTPVKADAKFVRSFLEQHCVDCHSAERKEGDFTLDKLASDNVAGRTAYASILERLRAGDMPPSKKARPDPAEANGVVQWIQTTLDAPLKEPVAYYPVKEKPIDGNRLPHAILFGGPRGPSVPPPPRLWRFSPSAYSKWIGQFQANGVQQPFGVIQDAGFKDFASLYAPDEGATSLMLTNAELVVTAQIRPHQLVNVNDKSVTPKDILWPNEARMKTATPEELEHLKKGDRVRQGNGVLAPLMHPKVAANREELTKAMHAQYLLAVSRPPSEKEIESLVELYKAVGRDGDYSIAGKTILMAPLMTPEAVLRFEIGLGAEVRPGVRMLSPRETAFAISMALSTARDPGLLTAAAQGKLTNREEVAQSVQRILDDPKIGKSRVMGFFREYFDYYRATDVFKDPLPNYQQRRGMGHNPGGQVSDTDLLMLHILGRDKDVLKELLTTRDSAHSHEGFDPSSALRDGPGGTPIFRQLPPGSVEHGTKNKDQIGIPMQPSWLVAWSVGSDNDIVRRGRWVREKLLGGRVPDLPINANAVVPEDPHRTLRQRQMVTRAAACWKCHYRMDDLGSPFEHVDHYGRPRPAEPVLDLEAMKTIKDKGKIFRDAPLDTTGFIESSGDPKLDGPVKDAPEML